MRVAMTTIAVIAIKRVIHKGLTTQIHPHVMYPISFNAINNNVSNPGKEIFLDITNLTYILLLNHLECISRMRLKLTGRRLLRLCRWWSNQKTVPYLAASHHKPTRIKALKILVIMA
jgi:hypothetical protein